jgi:hypothetical protein
MLNITTRTTVLLASATIFAACGRDHSNDKRASAAGALDTSAIDTAALRTSGATPATGPGIHVTRTDGKSVTRAMRYELTSDNFWRPRTASSPSRRETLRRAPRSGATSPTPRPPMPTPAESGSRPFPR